MKAVKRRWRLRLRCVVRVARCAVGIVDCSPVFDLTACTKINATRNPNHEPRNPIRVTRTMKPSVPDHILAIKPYVAGKPLEELEREYGIKDAVKLASNENPLGPSPLAVEAIGAAVSKLNRYPDGGGYEMTRCIAEPRMSA